MRIGIDIDDTISDTYQNNMDILKKYNYDIKDTRDFSEEEFEKFLNVHVVEILDTMKPKENVSKVLKNFKDNNCKIYILSSRNVNGYVPIKETIRFFNKYDIPYDEIYLDLKNKSEIASKLNLDLFIDDSNKHLDTCSSIGIKCIKFGNNDSKYKAFNDWIELENYVKEEYGWIG